MRVDRGERLTRLDELLRARRTGIGLSALLTELGCSRATLLRDLAYLRDALGVDIRHDPQRGGYVYAGDAPALPAPGLRLRPGEIETLFALHALTEDLLPSDVARRNAPLRQRLETLLREAGADPQEVRRRVQVLPAAARGVPAGVFEAVARALLDRTRLHIRYTSRETGQTGDRTVSPQRLVRWRDNWYLDAWCHNRRAVRTFALDAMATARALPDPARRVSERALRAQFLPGYGIFSGSAPHTAVLVFETTRAQFIAAERWHPRQRARWLPDGRYELCVPYADARELVLDILRYGPEVEVLAPEPLRAEVSDRLRRAAQRYGR